MPDFRKRCDAGSLDPVAVFDAFERMIPWQIDCMRWFHHELRRVFQVDPFATPFDGAAGYRVYPGPLADVLLIRTDRLNEVGERALRDFLGLEHLQLRPTNIRTAKANGRRYVELLRRIELPRAYVDRFYDTPAVRHFFTPHEIDRMRARWCGAREVAA